MTIACDLFVEVSHGPYVVDHNILASEYALDNIAQGGAYINNLIAGKMNQQKFNRSTQYHLPHSNKSCRFCICLRWDDLYNNLFIGKDGLETLNIHYKNYTTSLEEYIENVHKKMATLKRLNWLSNPFILITMHT